eukprot:gene7675-7877_t
MRSGRVAYKRSEVVGSGPPLRFQALGLPATAASGDAPALAANRRACVTLLMADCVNEQLLVMVMAYTMMQHKLLQPLLVPLYAEGCKVKRQEETAAFEMGERAGRVRMIDHPQGDQMNFSMYITTFMGALKG